MACALPVKSHIKTYATKTAFTTSIRRGLIPCLFKSLPLAWRQHFQYENDITISRSHRPKHFLSDYLQLYLRLQPSAKAKASKHLQWTVLKYVGIEDKVKASNLNIRLGQNYAESTGLNV